MGVMGADASFGRPLLPLTARRPAPPPPLHTTSGTWGKLTYDQIPDGVSGFPNEDEPVAAELKCEMRNLYYRQCISECARWAQCRVAPRAHSSSCRLELRQATWIGGPTTRPHSPRPPPRPPLALPRRSPRRADGRADRHRRHGAPARHHVRHVPVRLLQVRQQQGRREPVGPVQPLLPVDALHRPARRQG